MMDYDTSFREIPIPHPDRFTKDIVLIDEKMLRDIFNNITMSIGKASS